MKYFYIMGGSGTGKTTLSKTLEEFFPKDFKNLVEITTREKRENELDGVDYHFFSPEKFEEKKDGMFETVETQFAPVKYGGLKDDLDPEKWNAVVVSIEGFLSGARRKEFEDSAVLLNIVINSPLDVLRSSRDPSAEEKLNKSTLYPLLDPDSCVRVAGVKPVVLNIPYYEISLSRLKEIRNSREGLKAFLEEIGIRVKE